MSSRVEQHSGRTWLGHKGLWRNDFTIHAGKSKLCTCMPLYQISCDYSSTNALQVVFWVEANLLEGFLSLKKIS